MNTTIRGEDTGRHQVGWTRNGIDFTPVGESFDKPRQAIDYATELEGWGPASRSTSAPDLARLGAESRDEGPASSEVPVSSPDASSVCAGCGGPIAPGRHGQRRLTCSVVCRQRVARQSADEARRADTDGAGVLSHLPGPSEALAVPTSLEGLGGCALPSSSKVAGPDPSPGGRPGLLSLGF